MALLISEPSCSALLEHFHEQPVELEGGFADRSGDLELAVLAGAAADVEEAGALVMAVMDAPVQRRFKTLADAADEDGIADEIERFWLLDFVGHGLGCSLSVQPPPDATEQRMPKTAENVDGARKHSPGAAGCRERPAASVLGKDDAMPRRARVIKGGAGHGGDHELSQ